MTATAPYRLRSRVRISPPPLPRRTRIDDVLATLDTAAAARAAELVSAYDFELADWGRMCRPEEILESLYVLDLFDQHVGPHRPRGPGLDVGSKNWPYLPALAAALPGPWTGVEIDAHRRYATLVTRAAVARQRCRAVGDATYLAGSVEAVGGSFGLVSWFLPFVRIEPLRMWGLPDAAFDPPGLLAHVWSLLRPGGMLWVTNQGDEEARIQSGLFDDAGIEAESLGPMRSVLSPFRLVRTGWLARKAGRPGRVNASDGE